MRKRQVPEEVVCRLIGYNYHCDSCHEDTYYGYPMLEIDFGKGRYAEVCCWVYSAYEEWLKKKGGNHET